MRKPFVVPVIAIVLGVGSPIAAAQNSHGSMHARGEEAMGFDLQKTTHHFYLYPDGGAIDISVNDRSDHHNRDAIRTHLPHIAAMFGAGDLSTPHFIHGGDVPGARELAKWHDRLSFKYRETPQGGRVEVTTRDAEALKALHAFLRYQITEHKTGDSVEVRKSDGKR